jgi:hypothetical protein
MKGYSLLRTVLDLDRSSGWYLLVRSAVSLRVVAIHLVVPKAAETLANSWVSKLKQSDGVTPKIGTSLVP